MSEKNKINQERQEEYLRILKAFCEQKEVHGYIANHMYSHLRRRFPWYVVMYSKVFNSKEAIELHRIELLKNQFG